MCKCVCPHTYDIMSVYMLHVHTCMFEFEPTCAHAHEMLANMRMYVCVYDYVHVTVSVHTFAYIINMCV